jgi:hypothetical protein
MQSKTLFFNHSEGEVHVLAMQTANGPTKYAKIDTLVSAILSFKIYVSSQKPYILKKKKRLISKPK